MTNLKIEITLKANDSFMENEWPEMQKDIDTGGFQKEISKDGILSAEVKYHIS